MAPFSTDEALRARLPVVAPPAATPGAAGLPQVTTDAMESFACLADRCEDTCCRDWAVPLDRSSLEQLKTTLSRTPQGRERLVQLVVIGRPSQQARGAIQIQMDESGACPLLETDNRCGVHAAFGEAALTTACSVFPRTALAVDGQLEVNGSLGCPEVSRQVLLGDRPQHLRPANKPMLPRPYVGKTVNPDASDAYAAHFPLVRGALQRLLRRGEGRRPLGARLVAAANFADRVGAFFHAGTTAFAGAKDPFAVRRLEAEIAEGEAPALLDALERDLGAFPPTAAEASAALVGTMLLERLRMPHGPRYAALCKAVFASIQSEGTAGPTGTLDVSAGLTPADTWRVLARRSTALPPRLAARAALVLDNYADHFLLRHPYTDARTLLEYLQRLALHLAAVRFLVLGSPAIADLVGRAPGPDDQALFDAAAVHAVQTLTKAITHHVDFLDVSFGAVGQGGGSGFGRLVMLAKFLG